MSFSVSVGKERRNHRDRKRAQAISFPVTPGQSRLSPNICQLTQHLDTGLGLDAAGRGAAHTPVQCPIIYLHTVDT